MKQLLKITTILLLFLTIVSQGISQTNYKIGNDTIVGYSKEDNRKIAIIFIEGEKDKELLNNCNEAIEVYQSKEISYKYEILQLKQQTAYLQVDNERYLSEVTRLSDLQKKTYDSKQNWKKATFISGGTALGLLLFIIFL